jgi:hypothetical protein
MMKPLRLIYSSGGTARFAEIAVREGWLPGAQLPCTVYVPPHFADNKYRDFDRAQYVAALQEHRPVIATLLDLEHWNQLDEVLSLGEEVASSVQEALIIIPKVRGIIRHLPRVIGGLPVWLGYSIDTSNGGTDVPIAEFAGWDTHLLGGSPQEQMRLARGWTPHPFMRSLLDAPEVKLNVVSADTNYHQERAVKHAGFWVNGTAWGCKNRYFPTLKERGIQVERDAPYVAFEMSSRNIMQAWRDLGFTVNEHVTTLSA